MNINTPQSKNNGLILSVMSAVVALGLMFAIGVYFTKTANATSIGWMAGRIIDDSVFTDKSSMTASQIQTFLNAKVPTCDTYGQQISEFGAGDANHDGTSNTAADIALVDDDNDGIIRRWEIGKYYYNQTTFTCLKSYKEDNLSASQIIYNASQTYSISPRVLLVLLQKEQSLVTDDWPTNSQYLHATGFGCPDTAECDTQYYGFINQVTMAALMYHSIMIDSPDWYTPYNLGDNYIRYNPDAACGGSTVYIQNRATQALYNYTPYQPNTATLDANWGVSVTCGAYGNLNFYRYFTAWFGSTYSTVYDGVDYFAVFDANYYLDRYPDLQAAFGDNGKAALTHFVQYGMKEGRIAISTFDVNSYKNRYKDLRRVFENNLKKYYLHYINYGEEEGRIATGVAVISYITDYKGVEYSDIYNYSTYMSSYPDLSTVFSDNDAGAMAHFVKYGMSEGRQAIDTFNVISYQNRYYDLRHIFINNLKSYYLHYITYGIKEGRIATGDVIDGTSELNGVDYSLVYDFSYYISKYSDLKRIFEMDDIATIAHFIKYGMGEGRQASDTFNVTIYKNNYSDLRAAFDDNLKAYYLHYINYGEEEGRIAI